MADLSQHRRTPAELEAFKAAVQRIGLTAREIEYSMVEVFAAAGRAALAAAYPWNGKPPAWLPLTPARRADSTYFGRKRRARRARGRRIEARRNTPYFGGQIWLASARSGFRSYPPPKVMLLDEINSFPTGEPPGWIPRLMKRSSGSAFYVVPTEQDARAFFDPSLGEPWEEHADG
jgi:hypothetical protein